jgi:hypothetical protein
VKKRSGSEGKRRGVKEIKQLRKEKGENIKSRAKRQ